jgi:peptidyl-prolyl cis-trans isomerase SurA
VDGLAAIVGNNIVLHSDVLQQAQFIALEQNIDVIKSPYLFENIYKTTLNNIINQYAVLGVAEKDTNLIISNDEIDRALDQQINNFILRAGSESLFLEMAGMSMRQIRSEYWKDIRDMMMVERYQFSKMGGLDVSRVEVQSFFDVYKDSLPIIPEQYSFSVIEIPFIAGSITEQRTFNFLDSLKNIIIQELASFESLAKAHSEDPGTAPFGGFLGFTSRGTLVQGFEEIAYSLSPGEISHPIKTPFGYHIIRLIERSGEKISTQHILKRIDFSIEDKRLTLSSIDSVLALINGNYSQFDSLSNIYLNKYNNFSGVYNNYQHADIPAILQQKLIDIIAFPAISTPIETGDGLAIIYFSSYKAEILPNIESSWNLIYQYAKQNKQNLFFNAWVEDIKLNTYIKIFNN